jgi:uncharacterized repeat protein (TIGR04138 family)
MQEKIGLEDAVDRILLTDQRFHRDAYLFLREVLDLTVEKLGRSKPSRSNSHVSGRELLLGFRDHALEQFGPMVPAVLDTWGITSCGDIGDMVFSLIDTGIFGKSETDQREDFNDIFDFNEAFVQPFRCDPGNNVARNC